MRNCGCPDPEADQERDISFIATRRPMSVVPMQL
jgi:hypothetical protein